MKLGLIVDDNNWRFIAELLDDWRDRYEVELFSHRETNPSIPRGRFKKWLLRRSLRQFLDRNDVVFFEWAGPLSIVGSQISAKTPTIVRLHSYELFPHAPHIRWDSVDRIILISQAMRRKFVDLFPEQAEKTRVVSFGKSLKEFQQPLRESVDNIGMLCDLIPLKRVYEVILTLHELRKKDCILKLHLGGEPRKDTDNERYFVSIRRAVEKLALGNQVVFHGWVDDVASWLQQIDIFISNSFWEGQQIALLEAMSAGCYCLSHFWDGAEEILPQKYLYVTDADLQQKIIEYCELSNHEKRRHQAELRYIIEKKFHIERMRVLIREIIEELAEKGKQNYASRHKPAVPLAQFLTGTLGQRSKLVNKIKEVTNLKKIIHSFLRS